MGLGAVLPLAIPRRHRRALLLWPTRPALHMCRGCGAQCLGFCSSNSVPSSGQISPPHLRHRVFQLALDETDAEIWLPGAHGTHYFMMQHVILLQRYHDGAKREHEVVIPPSVLENQGAECVFAAVERRCGDVAWPSSPDCSVYVLILGSDSHRALAIWGRGISSF